MTILTERAIFSTFEAMLEEMPFDKITVAALVKRCGISANTFYYHYQDIHELLTVWLNRCLGSEIMEVPEDDWKGRVKKLAQICKSHPKATYHIWNSLSRDRMEQYLFRISDDAISRRITAYAKKHGVPGDRIPEISRFCRYAFVGFFMQFLHEKMTADIDQSVDSLSELFEEFVHSSVEKYGTS